MSRLAPDLFQRRYRDLVEIGQSRLPGLAPAWTDHNAHDPGITLIELLAWVAEAQLYSLSRTRRDERMAYAALMGVEPHGSRPAKGLVWPDHDDPEAPASTIGAARIIERDAPARLEGVETPAFRTAFRQLWIPGRMDALKSRFADGTIVDHGAANRRGGPAFMPFGEGDGQGAVLIMSLSATGHRPLLGEDRPMDARLVIGIRAAPARGGTAPDHARSPVSPLRVTLAAEDERIDLPIVEDGSQGMLRTGALVLDLSGVATAAMSATLEFSAPGGFAREPRLLRIEPNVVPIIQQLWVTERHDSDGFPDQGFDLETPGLSFEPGSDPLEVDIELPDAVERWTQVDRLADCGPGDRCFALDPVAARVTFGNGINGRVPPAGSHVVLRYRVSGGRAGNVAANRKWVVAGFSGLFGINPDASAGGEDPSGWLEQRREARIALVSDHALVSAADFERAARDLAGLEVGRAWMMPPSAADLATGTIRLVAMRTRTDSAMAAALPETGKWLETVRRRLAPRTPLGSRLRLLAPAYVDFSVKARVEAEAKKDPEAVRQRILEELGRRLTLIATRPGATERPFGLPVTQKDMVAWIQALGDVRRVNALSIVLADGRTRNEVRLAPAGLPRIDLVGSLIEVERFESGGSS